MKKMTINSKWAQNWLSAHVASEYGSVNQVYKRPSRNKIIAEIFCRKRFRKENGHLYRIISATDQFFTAAWKTPDGNLRVETAHNSYLIEL